MAFPNMLYCIGPLILLVALLRDWRVTETDVSSVAKDVENLKVQLKEMSLRLHQLEKSKEKDIPQSYTPLEHDRDTDEPGQRDRNTLPSWLNLFATGHGLMKGQEIRGSDENVRSMRLEATVKKLNLALQIFSELATSQPGHLKPARIARSLVVVSEMNSSQTLSCETQGNPIRSCLWTQKGAMTKGKNQVIIALEKDEGDAANPADDDSREVDKIRIIHDGDELQTGKCLLKIDSVTEEDFGSWACTLMDETGALFSGRIQFTTEERIEPAVYFGVSGGMKTYSVSTSEVKTFGGANETVFGVTYDFVQDKIYWSSRHMIHRGNRDGTEDEIMLSTSPYGNIYALDFDWITGNVYGSTGSGYIFVCKTNTSGSFVCATVLIQHQEVKGLTLHPIQGKMFWTSYSSRGSISRAGMDGSDPVLIVEGLSYPAGLAIDFHNSGRLYWTCGDLHNVQSSDIQGRDIQTVTQRPYGSFPYGIGLSGDRIYWTNSQTSRLESGTKAGEDVNILHVGKDSFYQLAIVPRMDLPTNPTNHCKNRVCSNVCVLTPTSFSCLS